MPHEFEKIEDPPAGAKVYTQRELELGTGKNGAPLYVCINGKVREWVGDKKNREFE